MIGHIRGEVLDKTPDHVLVDVNGVGFVVHVPAPLLDNIDRGLVSLFTHLHVRENELTLYGFGDREALQLFRTLLSVQGIGPKVALAIISNVSIETLRQAVARDEVALLARVPGIGPKKARQLLFVLKDKIELEDVLSVGGGISDVDNEVLAALTSLGYSVTEAQAALKTLSEEDRHQPLEEQIRLALSSLSRL